MANEVQNNLDAARVERAAVAADDGDDAGDRGDGNDDDADVTAVCFRAGSPFLRACVSG